MKEVLKLLIFAMAALLTSLLFVGGEPDHFLLEKSEVGAHQQLPLSRILGDERLRGKLIPGQRDRSKSHGQPKKEIFSRQLDQVKFGINLIRVFYISNRSGYHLQDLTIVYFSYLNHLHKSEAYKS